MTTTSWQHDARHTAQHLNEPSTTTALWQHYTVQDAMIIGITEWMKPNASTQP